MGTVIIYVRTNVDWLRMTKESFQAQTPNVNLPMALIRHVSMLSIIDTWEQAYGLDYFLYRATLQHICRNYHADTFYGCEYSCGELPNGSPNDLIFPIDDDDIFTDIDSPLDILDHGANLVTWDRHTVVHGKSRVEGRRKYLDTCNWAIRRSFLDYWQGQERELFLAKHQFANKYVGTRLGCFPRIIGQITPTMLDQRSAKHGAINHPEVIDLKKTCSNYYLHTGSISYLSHKRGKTDDLRKLPLHPLFNSIVYSQLEKERDNGDITSKATTGKDAGVSLSTVRNQVHSNQSQR